MGNNAFIEASVSALGRVCLGFLYHLVTTSYASQPPVVKEKDDFTASIDAFHEVHSRIEEERNTIISRLNQAVERNCAEHRSAVSPAFFSAKSENKTTRKIELLKAFSERFNTYPQFSAEEARMDPNYVKTFTEYFLKYHEDVTKEYEELLREIDNESHVSCQSALSIF